ALNRPAWLGGAATLAVAAGLAAAVGLLLRSRSWPAYLGFGLGFLLLMGWIERQWRTRRRPAAAPRARGRLKVIRGGKSDYDLEKDDSTDTQRWLMLRRPRRGRCARRAGRRSPASPGCRRPRCAC